MEHLEHKIIIVSFFNQIMKGWASETQSYVLHHATNINFLSGPPGLLNANFKLHVRSW